MTGEYMHRLRALWRRSDMEAGLDEEIRFHIEQQTKKHIAQGMTPETARRAAEQRFGGVDHMKERTRDEFRPALIEDTIRDLRYGVRTLMRAPGFAFVSILTLGLGIGAATAVFSVLNGVLLRPLPYPSPDRIVRLFQVSKDGRDGNVSNANFVDLKEQSHSFQYMAEVAQYGKTTVLTGNDAQRVRVSAVSREFLDVMQTTPVVGRRFGPEDHREGAGRVALVSDEYWKSSLGGRRLNGQTIRFDNEVYEVAGVMPAGFDYPNKTDIWVPSELDRPAVSRTAHNYAAVARMSPNATAASATADVSAIAKRLKALYGDETWMSDARVIPLQENLTGSAKPVLLVLFGAAAFLLLIACANVSSLLLARGATRRRELAVRLAMGAGRVAVTRQLMAESMVLCVAGGALGVLIASVGMRLLLSHNPGSLPRVEEIHLDWMSLLFASGIALATAIILGLATSARASQRDLRSLISNDGRTLTGGVNSQRVRDLLVVAQVALTIVLLVAAGLLSRSFLAVLRIDPGFRTEDALIMDISLPSANDAALMQRQVQFQTALLERLRALPGTTSAGIINDFPIGGVNYANGQFLEMSTPDEIGTFEQYRALAPADINARSGNAGYRIASQGYFDAMGIKVIRGRGFEPGDGAGAPQVALISESLAKTKWGGRDPLGRYIQFGNMDGDMHGLRIVGVVSDVREFGPEALPAPLLYADYRQRPASISSFSAIIRGPAPESIRRSVGQILHDLDPQIPVVTRTMAETIDRTFAGRRFSLLIIGMFSIVALILATLGLYGVISYLVAQRTREIGIRTVLGAPKTMLMRLVLSKAAALALFGTVLGIAGALGFTRLLKGLLFGSVSTTDPASFAGVIATIALAVLAATAVPVRRALRISPMMALRDE
jgi:predicted permease